MIELTVTVAVLSVVAGMAAGGLQVTLPAAKGDAALRVIRAQVATARELAISQRRYMEVEFVQPDFIRVLRHDLPSGTTVMSSAILEGGVKYQVVSGVPDTPDAFGNAASPDFGPAEAVMFGTDGMLIDAAGDPANGTVFLAIPDEPRSARALTLFGATGRVRAYRWDGSQWTGR